MYNIILFKKVCLVVYILFVKYIHYSKLVEDVDVALFNQFYFYRKQHWAKKAILCLLWEKKRVQFDWSCSKRIQVQEKKKILAWILVPCPRKPGAGDKEVCWLSSLTARSPVKVQRMNQKTPQWSLYLKASSRKVCFCCQWPELLPSFQLLTFIIHLLPHRIYSLSSNQGI